jgi:hypothetical protein
MYTNPHPSPLTSKPWTYPTISRRSDVQSVSNVMSTLWISPSYSPRFGFTCVPEAAHATFEGRLECGEDGLRMTD